jgi:hypothetical protein
MVHELDIKNSLQNLITKNNTITSSWNLSSSLSSQIVTISGGNSNRVPVLNIDYPAVFIELDGINDNHVEMGKTSRRDVEMSFKITCVTDYGIAREDYEDTDNEMIQLTYNLHNLLRNNVKISNTCDSCLITGTDYTTDEGTYNARSVTNLLIKKRG